MLRDYSWLLLTTVLIDHKGAYVVPRIERGLAKQSSSQSSCFETKMFQYRVSFATINYHCNFSDNHVYSLAFKYNTREVYKHVHTQSERISPIYQKATLFNG